MGIFTAARMKPRAGCPIERLLPFGTGAQAKIPIESAQIGRHRVLKTSARVAPPAGARELSALDPAGRYA